MRCAVFYISRFPHHRRTMVKLDDMTRVYIRADIIDTADVVDALDKAAPLPGESVMNSHEIPNRPKWRKEAR